MVEILPNSSFDVFHIVDDILKKSSSLILGDSNHDFVLEDDLIQIHCEEGQSEEGNNASNNIEGNKPDTDCKSENDQPDGFHE